MTSFGSLVFSLNLSAVEELQQHAQPSGLQCSRRLVAPPRACTLGQPYWRASVAYPCRHGHDSPGHSRRSL